MSRTRKITETEKILDRYFADYRDAYIIARMAILQVTCNGTQGAYHTAEYIRKACEKNHADDGREYTDENGVKHFKISMTTAELDADIVLCTQEIRRALNEHRLDYSDFFKCCSEFFPTR